MAENRTRHSTAQPRSYKEFSEKGHAASAIAESNKHDQAELMHQHATDESRDASNSDSWHDTDNEDIEVIIKSPKRTRHHSTRSNKSTSSQASKQSHHTATNRLTHETHDTSGNSSKTDMSAMEDEVFHTIGSEDHGLALHIDPEEDNLDADKYGGKGRAGKSGKHAKTPSKTPSKIEKRVKDSNNIALSPTKRAIESQSNTKNPPKSKKPR